MYYATKAKTAQKQVLLQSIWFIKYRINYNIKYISSECYILITTTVNVKARTQTKTVLKLRVVQKPRFRRVQQTKYIHK